MVSAVQQSFSKFLSAHAHRLPKTKEGTVPIGMVADLYERYHNNREEALRRVEDSVILRDESAYQLPQDADIIAASGPENFFGNPDIKPTWAGAFPSHFRGSDGIGKAYSLGNSYLSSEQAEVAIDKTIAVRNEIQDRVSHLGNGVIDLSDLDFFATPAQAILYHLATTDDAHYRIKDHLEQLIQSYVQSPISRPLMPQVAGIFLAPAAGFSELELLHGRGGKIEGATSYDRSTIGEYAKLIAGDIGLTVRQADIFDDTFEATLNADLQNYRNSTVYITLFNLLFNLPRDMQEEALGKLSRAACNGQDVRVLANAALVSDDESRQTNYDGKWDIAFGNYIAENTALLVPGEYQREVWLENDSRGNQTYNIGVKVSGQMTDSYGTDLPVDTRGLRLVFFKSQRLTEIAATDLAAQFGLNYMRANGNPQLLLHN